MRVIKVLHDEVQLLVEEYQIFLEGRVAVVVSGGWKRSLPGEENSTDCVYHRVL